MKFFIFMHVWRISNLWLSLGGLTVPLWWWSDIPSSIDGPWVGKLFQGVSLFIGLWLWQQTFMYFGLVRPKISYPQAHTYQQLNPPVGFKTWWEQGILVPLVSHQLCLSQFFHYRAYSKLFQPCYCESQGEIRRECRSFRTGLTLGDSWVCFI